MHILNSFLTFLDEDTVFVRVSILAAAGAGHGWREGPKAVALVALMSWLWMAECPLEKRIQIMAQKCPPIVR